MSEDRRTAADRARQRDYHRRRAIVARIGKEATAYAVDRMTEPELWLFILQSARQAEQRVQTGSDIELARTVRDLYTALNEVYLRGHQLSLDL